MAKQGKTPNEAFGGDARSGPGISSLPRQLGSLVTILDEVRSGTSRTRPELIASTGLSRAVVAQRSAELCASGLVEEAELGASTGGRAPRILRFRSESGYLLAAELGATSITVALTDLSAGIVDIHEEPSDISAGPHVILERVKALFDELLERHRDRPGQLWGVGIGLPGPVEFSSGRAVAPPIMLGWDQFPVREAFASRYGAPVWVDNDVNVLALGEVRAGVGRGHDLVVFVKIGTGIGAGIVVNGHILRGAQGCAGDVGHIRVTDDPTAVCRCGKIGCLEELAGGRALGRRGEAAAREGASRILGEVLAAKGSIDAEDVAHASHQGDPVALELITDAGSLVGGVLASLVNFVNPSLIVIGGGVARAGDGLLATIRQTLYARSLPLATRDLLVQRSALDGTGGVIGVASMVADELFAPHTLNAWLDAGHPGVLSRLDRIESRA
jgi:glucokinase-like ROK family protein